MATLETGQDQLIIYLERNGLEYLDKRDKLGCLWVLGGQEISATMKELQKYGVKMHYKAGGGNITGGCNAWWTKDRCDKPISLNNKVADGSLFSINTNGEMASSRCTVQQGKADFTNWLKAEGFRRALIDIVIWNMSKASALANDLNITYASLFTLCDSDEVSGLLKELEVSNEFQKFREKNKNALLAIRKYEEFRKETWAGRSNQTIVQGALDPKKGIDNREIFERELFKNYFLESDYSIDRAEELLSVLKEVSEYAEERRLSRVPLLLIKDVNRLMDIWYAISVDPLFKQRDASTRKRISVTMRHYIHFRRVCAKREPLTSSVEATSSGENLSTQSGVEVSDVARYSGGLKKKQPGQESQTENIQPFDNKKAKEIPFKRGTSLAQGEPSRQHSLIRSVLITHFKYGFNIDSPIELIRFRNNCESESATLVDSLDDETLKDNIRACGIEVDGKVYVFEDSSIEKVIKHVNECIEEGMQLFFYEEFYEHNEEWLNDANIYDVRILKALLMTSFPKYSHKNHFFSVDSQMAGETKAVSNEILRVWGEPVLRSYSELEQLLVYVPLDKIKYNLSYNDLFVWNSQETYTRRDRFKTSKEWIDEIVDFATERCDETGSVSFDELPLEEIAAENYELSKTALHDLVFSFMKDGFSRNGKVISLKGTKRDAVTMIQEYCRQCDSCTLDQLMVVMKEAEGVVRYPTIIEAANAVMVRAEENLFVNDNQIHFDVLKIDGILDGIIDNNAIGIQSITVFAAFPDCGVSWNLFVLESYCRRFSKMFRYDCITANSNNSGAIIRKTSKLTYQDAMAEIVANSTVELNEQKVFDYLIDSGLIIRRRYSEMDVLLKKASAIRKGLE